MLTESHSEDPAPVWKIANLQWLVIAMATAAVIVAFLPGLRFMVANWEALEEYSYGYFIPVVCLFLIWQRSDRLRRLELRGSWTGLLLVMLALALGAVGDLSAIRLFSQYGFVIAVFGMSVCLIGWHGTRIIAVPLGILVFMIPLPQFLLRELSQQLQLLSSQLGVALIRLFGISVFLEGNVIDLGSFKLQVVEACSGLRYLFPLLVLGCLAAYFFQGSWWKRALIIVSTIPLTIIINSLRIGLIGVTVEYWGSAMAEGLLHDFEGFFMFMLCLVLLFGEMAVLARVGGPGRPLRTVFGMDYPASAPRGATVRSRRLSLPMIAALSLFAAAAGLSVFGPSREQTPPKRKSFAEFPMSLPSGWSGRMDRLDRDVIATLAVDDYLLADYVRPGEPPVNLYTAYYNNQSGGQSSHSPRTCIPGGGWSISQIEERPLSLGTPDSSGVASLVVNRAIIQKGEQRQLVYYWFQQRGRAMTSELLVKWFILQDGITRDRSDGALVRLVTPIAAAESPERADQRLIDFMRGAAPRLRAYIPD